MPNRTGKQRGSTIIEFTLVGIPLVFVLFSTVEMARGMWSYETLAHALKDATRYASTHGNGCTNLSNACAIEVADVARRIQSSGAGLDPSKVSFTLTDNGGSVSCSTLTSCLSNSTSWPTTLGGVQGSNLTVTGTYQFQSVIAMFWPGVSQGSFGAVNLPASARESVQF